MATRFHIDAVFKALDKFSAPVAKMTTRMDRFTRRVRKGMWGIGKMTKRVARNMRNLSLTMGSLVVLGGFALKGLIDPAMRFQHAMDGVNAVTLGLYKEHMPKLAEKAKDLGKRTTFTATRVANAMEILQRSGMTVAETLATIEPVLRGAEAAGTSIETMSDILVSTTKAMDELKFEDATDTVNAYAVAASRANTTIEKLGEGMVKAAPIANTLDIRFDDLLATVATLQDAGIEASMSGSQLRTMLTRLTALTPKAAKRFKRLGIEVVDASGNMLSMPKILANVAKGLAKVQGNASKVADIQKAVGLRGAVAANLLIKSWEKGPEGGIQKIMAAIAGRAEDAAEQMSKMRLDQNLLGDLVKLKSAWEFFRIEVVSESLPALRDVVKSLTRWLLEPGNIKLVADKWNSAVEGLKLFWAQNKDSMLKVGTMTLNAARILWEVVKVAFHAVDKLTPDMDTLRSMYGTDLPEGMKRGVAAFELTGKVPDDPNRRIITKGVDGKNVKVDPKEPALLYIDVADGLKATLNDEPGRDAFGGVRMAPSGTFGQ